MEEPSIGRDVLEAAEEMAGIRTDADEGERRGVGGVELEGDGLLACSRDDDRWSKYDLSTDSTLEAGKHIRRVSERAFSGRPAWIVLNQQILS